MPDFKLVISDPATKNPKVLDVKVKVSDKVESVKGEKEGKALPVALMNQKTKEALGADNFVTIETVKQEGDKKQKVKTHLLIKVSNEVPENEIWVSQTVGEKHGGNEFDAKAYRTKAFQIAVDQTKLPRLIGAKIGDVFETNVVGVNLKLKITGGSDNSGFPMRFDVSGPAKRKIILSGPPGYRPKEDVRKKKMVRGNQISGEIVQVNTVIVR
ncbi:MAG: 30S ribosomal protein S6e [Thermoprotei archaeon]